MLARLFSLALVLVALNPITATAQDRKVLLIAAEKNFTDLEYMLTEEVGVMTAMLEKAGFEVDVATASGTPLAAETKTLEPDYKFAEIAADDYAGIILPCMAAERPEPIEPELAAIIKGAVEQGKPVAAQFGGVMWLAKAGVLSGQKFSQIEDYANIPEFEDAVYAGTHAVVKDGNIITSGVCPYIARESGLPDGTVELTQVFIAELEATD